MDCFVVKRDLPVTGPQSRSEMSRVVFVAFRILLLVSNLCLEPFPFLPSYFGAFFLLL